WRIDIYAHLIQFMENRLLDFHLCKLGVFQAMMPRMVVRRTDISRIWTIHFQNTKTGILEKILNCLCVIQTPLATKTWRIPKKCASGFSGFRIDDISFWVNTS